MPVSVMPFSVMSPSVGRGATMAILTWTRTHFTSLLVVSVFYFQDTFSHQARALGTSGKATTPHFLIIYQIVSTGDGFSLSFPLDPILCPTTMTVYLNWTLISTLLYDTLMRNPDTYTAKRAGPCGRDSTGNLVGTP